jgi:Calx-beta domain
MFMRKLILVFLAAVAGFTGLAANVQYYLVVKGLNLEQTNAAAPLVVTNESPFRFLTEVLGTDTNSVTNATVLLPAKLRLALTNVAGADAPADFVVEQGFTNKALLDKQFAAGSYTVVIQSANASNSALLKLPGDAYPVVPHIANWPDLQAVESELPCVIQWNSLTNLSTNDLVAVDVEDTNGVVLASSPGFFLPGALNGTNVAVAIPAGVLEAGQNYFGQLLAIKVGARNTNSVSGAPGVAGYFRQTQFPLATLPEPVSGGRVQLGASAYSVAETAGSAVVTVTRVGDEGNSVSVNLATAAGTAVDGVNYLGVNTNLTFDAGVTSTNIAIAIFNDYQFTSNRAVNLVLSGLTGDAVFGDRSNAVLTILDSQKAGAGTVQFLPVTYPALGSAASVTLTLKRNGGGTGAVGAHFRTVDGTAQAGLDYVATNGTLVFASGKTSLTLPVRLINRRLNAANMYFYAVLDATTGGASLGTNLTAVISLTDNTPGGTVNLATRGYTTNEDAGFFYVTVARTGTGALASNASVDFTTLDGSAIAGLDYVATNGTLTFGTNQASRTVAIPLLINPNANGFQNFSFQIYNPQNGAVLGTNLTAALTIRYTNACIAISNAAYVVANTNAGVTLSIVRFGALNTTATADYTTVDGTAVAPVNYVATSGSAVFTPGVSNVNVTVPIVPTTVVQPDRIFTFALTNLTGGVPPGNISNAVVAIVNENFPGTIQFATNTFSGYEGSNAIVRVTRSGGQASGVTVALVMTNGTGMAGIDYSNVSQLVTFSAGVTNVNVSVPLLVDPLNLSFKTAGLTLTNATGGATLGINQTATLKILNNPKLNGVPLNGPLFISGSVGNGSFNSATNTCTVSSDSTSPLVLNASWYSASATGLVQNQLSITIFPRPNGTVNFDNYSATDSASYQYLPLNNPTAMRTWSVGGSNGLTPGAIGSFTLDAIDYTQKLASGQFTLKLQETTSGEAGGNLLISGKFRVALVP